MRKYLVNEVKINGYSLLITLLDYETKISDVLKIIMVPSKGYSKVLVDTALVAGMGKYRFISSILNKNGEFDFGNYVYIDGNREINTYADSILSTVPNQVKYSILTVSQKNKIVRNLLYY